MGENTGGQSVFHVGFIVVVYFIARLAEQKKAGAVWLLGKHKQAPIHPR